MAAAAAEVGEGPRGPGSLGGFCPHSPFAVTSRRGGPWEAAVSRGPGARAEVRAGSAAGQPRGRAGRAEPPGGDGALGERVLWGVPRQWPVGCGAAWCRPRLSWAPLSCGVGGALLARACVNSGQCSTGWLAGGVSCHASSPDPSWGGRHAWSGWYLLSEASYASLCLQNCIA